MSAKKPRAAYCTGCGKLFGKMHLLINHRRLMKCGGRFLPAIERDEIMAAKHIREFINTEIHPLLREFHTDELDNHLLKATLLRTARLQRVT